MAFKPTEAKISLHGLGFLQLQLSPTMRLHVWHPELPRRSCFEHSSIHDHRFGFESRVLVGTQINHEYRPIHVGPNEVATHTAYLHEGSRTAFGNRPWIPDFELSLERTYVGTYPPGYVYSMEPYVYHRTEPGGDGRVATLLTKTFEGNKGAHSLCKRGVTPDADFDRNQLSVPRMWEFVRDVLGNIPVIPSPRCVKKLPCECTTNCGDDGKGRQHE